MQGIVSAAEALASDVLAVELPNRFQHVLAVGRRALNFSRAPNEDPRNQLLVAAGLVHDVGYAEHLEDTGFHPIDGARFLRSVGFDERVVCLVAHHTCAHIEADLRGLSSTLLSEFPKDDGLPHDELLYCDLTTGPTGEIITVEDRLADVKLRYGPEDLVYRFIELAEYDLVAAVRRAERLIPPPCSPLPQTHQHRQLDLVPA